ncbi:MAG: hypothetical protein Q8L60_06450 [Gammaproteobacteria bacterium]|nr:hypothetical protein [Gammaproteobacteria bacterium]MDP2142060.1 hypothetical protein [Gammaproteobacteria bacterium]MDP2348361.1 hypothetical protein [Gammaproteobacteria bacterium]
MEQYASDGLFAITRNIDQIESQASSVTPHANTKSAEAMKLSHHHYLRAPLPQNALRLGVLLLGVFCCSLIAIAAEGPLGRSSPLRPDFSGSWEKDFARSDRWEEEIQRTIDQLNREAQIQQRRSDGSAIGMSNPRRSAGNVIANARLAELISRQNTMRITQTASEVRIERQGDAALICSTANNAEDTFSSAHGTEYCGWDRTQLVFEIVLSAGVLITHRFSVDTDGQTLSMLTTVTDRNSVPFNLIQFFNRYDAPDDNYDCVQTLSRGLVCSPVRVPE